MKNFKYLFLFVILAGFIQACVEDTAPEDSFAKAKNIASFTSAAVNLTAVATGDEYDMSVTMEVKGPTVPSINGPVTATIEVDPSSTAVEGVHYRLETNTIQLDPDNNLLGRFPITVLTEGIEPPLAVAPRLVLRVKTAEGKNVIANGKPLNVDLLYLCDSQLQGAYTVTITRNDGMVYEFDEQIERIGPGEYRGVSVGHYEPGSLGGVPGFNFVDVCGVITVPEQNLVDLYSNLVYGINSSSVLENGDLSIEYEITFAAGNRQYVAIYHKL